MLKTVSCTRQDGHDTDFHHMGPESYTRPLQPTILHRISSQITVEKYENIGIYRDSYIDVFLHFRFFFAINLFFGCFHAIGRTVLRRLVVSRGQTDDF